MECGEPLDVTLPRKHTQNIDPMFAQCWVSVVIEQALDQRPMFAGITGISEV